MVKRSIEQEIRNKNFGNRIVNFEKNAVVKNQGTKQRVQRILGDCWQWDCNGIYQIAFPITVLPKDDHKDFAQEERLSLPYWSMILAICVVVDESKCLDTPIWEFSIICEHLPFLLGYKLILRQLLVHRNLAIWR